LINIILGPPGTGKTTTLLNICHQKKEQGISWDKIGFFSFSKKAAYEARDRAREKFQASKDDLIHFRTLHSFAYKHLPMKENSLMKSKHWKELSKIIGFDLVFDTNDDSIYSNSNHVYVNLINLSRLKNIPLKDAWNYGDHTINWSKLDYLNRCIEEYKEQNKLFDFSDMIINYTNDTFLTQFDVLFIDEAQDMPRIQYNMVDKLIKNSKETYIAGDDDQAIFRWSGADVDKFINLKGNVTVLDKSYRCPKRIYRLANYIITRIQNRRSKNWEPKNTEGKVIRVAHLKHIDLSTGNWLLLGRTKKIRNEMIEDFLKERGYWYGRGDHRPVPPSTLDAIETWQRLKKGETASLLDVKNLYNKIKSEINKNGKGIKRGGKTFKGETEESLFTLQDLKNNHGLLSDGKWYDVLDNISDFDIVYLRRLEQVGENIKGEPRIRVSTIHQAKGGECDNVVILLDLGRIVYKSYTKNPDDEHRVFYVAVTRTKENLYMVEAQTHQGYRI
tara:strand:+ start:7003 stop:8508 length:1506 start_codon:yes stop_codon:yes gene_type:complete